MASPAYEGDMENVVVGPAEPIYLVNPFTGEPYVLSTLPDVAVPSVDSIANVLSRDVIGNKLDTIDGDSLMAYIKLIKSTHIISGTSPDTGGTANTAIRIELDSNASAVDGAYDPSIIFIVSGTGAGQSREIWEYDGTNKYAYVSRDWKTIPDNTSVYCIMIGPGNTHVNEGVAQGGSNNTITLNTLASTQNNLYLGQIVFIAAGTGQDQAKMVVGYVGATKVATVDSNWIVNPDTTSVYAMLPYPGFVHGVPGVDSSSNILSRDVVGNKGDAADESIGTASLVALLRQALSDLDTIIPSASHHEHVFPRSDGKGTAGDLLNVITDADDESNAAASTVNYWGEPTLFDPPETTILDLLGIYVEADTAQKTFQIQVLVAEPSLSSAKAGVTAWNEGETVLTVVDGSLFLANDLVAIISDYKVEIQEVASVLGDDVTVVRETSQFGANNTGLRWNHTTNAAGTETMYRVWRADVTQYTERYFSAASGKESRDINFHDHRIVEALGLFILRALNQTDNTNGAHFHAAPSYEN